MKVSHKRKNMKKSKYNKTKKYKRNSKTSKYSKKLRGGDVNYEMKQCNVINKDYNCTYIETILPYEIKAEIKAAHEKKIQNTGKAEKLGSFKDTDIFLVLKENDILKENDNTNPNISIISLKKNVMELLDIFGRNRVYNISKEISLKLVEKNLIPPEYYKPG